MALNTRTAIAVFSTLVVAILAEDAADDITDDYMGGWLFKDFNGTEETERWNEDRERWIEDRCYHVVSSAVEKYCPDFEPDVVGTNYLECTKCLMTTIEYNEYMPRYNKCSGRSWGAGVETWCRHLPDVSPDPATHGSSHNASADTSHTTTMTTTRDPRSHRIEFDSLDQCDGVADDLSTCYLPTLCESSIVSKLLRSQCPIMCNTCRGAITHAITTTNTTTTTTSTPTTPTSTSAPRGALTPNSTSAPRGADADDDGDVAPMLDADAQTILMGAFVVVGAVLLGILVATRIGRRLRKTKSTSSPSWSRIPLNDVEELMDVERSMGFNSSSSDGGDGGGRRVDGSMSPGASQSEDSAFGTDDGDIPLLDALSGPMIYNFATGENMVQETDINRLPVGLFPVGGCTASNAGGASGRNPAANLAALHFARTPNTQSVSARSSGVRDEGHSSPLLSAFPNSSLDAIIGEIGSIDSSNPALSLFIGEIGSIDSSTSTIGDHGNDDGFSPAQPACANWSHDPKVTRLPPVNVGSLISGNFARLSASPGRHDASNSKFISANGSYPSANGSYPAFASIFEPEPNVLAGVDRVGVGVGTHSPNIVSVGNLAHRPSTLATCKVDAAPAEDGAPNFAQKRIHKTVRVMLQQAEFGLDAPPPPPPRPPPRKSNMKGNVAKSVLGTKNESTHSTDKIRGRVKKRRVCSTEGCSTPTAARGKCKRHGAFGKCGVENCTTQAESVLKGLCKKHGGGAKKVCKTAGCNTFAQARGLCNKHGAQGICHLDGCTINAIAGSPVCFKHGVCTKKKCSVLDCTTRSKARGLCAKHGGGALKCTTLGCTNKMVSKLKTCQAHGGYGCCTHERCSNHAGKSSQYCYLHSK